jgi:hypothetical protein
VRFVTQAMTLKNYLNDLPDDFREWVEADLKETYLLALAHSGVNFPPSVTLEELLDRDPPFEDLLKFDGEHEYIIGVTWDIKDTRLILSSYYQRFLSNKPLFFGSISMPITRALDLTGALDTLYFLGCR